jgi:hypothetical protein
MRYVAEGVDKWELLEERGFAFFLIKGRRDGVWFHVSELPEEIRHWFPRYGKRQPYIPKVSFEIVISPKNNKEQAANIRLEPPVKERVLFWRDGDRLISLKSAENVDIWPDSKINLQESEFWYCKVFRVLSKFDGLSANTHLALPSKKFVVGEDKFKGEILPKFLLEWQEDLVDDFKIDAVAGNGDDNALLKLSDRLEKLTYSFGVRLSEKNQKIIENRIWHSYPNLSEAIVNKLQPFFPVVVFKNWQQKAKLLPIIALDLESDGSNIWEFALVGQEGVIADLKNPTDEDIKQELAKIPTETFLIGHNIHKWDWPILTNKGLAIPHPKKSDTLLREMLINPLRQCYALDTKHRAADDAQITIELARNQFIREHNQSSFVTKIVGEESDKFFLHPPTPSWYDKIESLLEIEEKILIIGPQEYAEKLMQPPKLQVIQPTGKPVFFETKNKKFWRRYVEEIESRGFGAIAELAPGVFRDKWTLSEEKIIPEIPEQVSRVYCSFADYFNGYIRAEILNWKPEETHLLFPEMSPFNSRQRLTTLAPWEYREKIEENGLWMHFALGRSYVSLDLLGLKIEDFQVPAEKSYMLTHFWLEKTIKGEIELWGCVAAKDLKEDDDYRVKEHSINNSYSAKFLTPVIKNLVTEDGEEIRDNRLTPETCYRGDYWDALLPLILSYFKKWRRVILAVNQWEEIEQVRQLLVEAFAVHNWGNAEIFSFDNNKSTRLNIRRLAKLKAAIFIIPMTQLDKSIQEWQLISLEENDKDKLTVILESLPVRLTPALGVVNLGDKSQESLLIEEDALTENREEAEENPDGEEREVNEDELEELGEEEIETVTETNNEQKRKLPRLRDLVSASIPVLEKIALLLPAKSNLQLVCLDSRLAAVSFQKRYFLVRDFLKALPEINEKVTAKNYFHQPEVKDWELPEESIWQRAIEKAFIPGYSLNEEQKEHLKAIMPRQINHRFVSLPTGGGKSIIFQGPALYRGYQTRRLTVVISPLKALIKDQERSLWEKGFTTTVDGLTGDMSRAEIDDCYQRIRGGETLLIYAAPERFRSKRFREVLEERFNRDGEPEYWVFDEAHCLSLWGLDFRPDYFYAAGFVKEQIKAGRRAPILLMSATITAQVKNDLCRILGIG